MPDNVKKQLVLKKISFGHARALISAKNINKLCDIVIQEKLNVRQTEDLVKNEIKIREISNKRITKLNEKDPNISDYEKYLSLKVGYEVQIKDKSGKGIISVKYKNLDQLEEIISIFNDKK